MKIEFSEFKIAIEKHLAKMFEAEGDIESQVFYLKNENLLLNRKIDANYFSSEQNKDKLLQSIRETCKDSSCRAVAIIIQSKVRDESGKKLGSGFMIIYSSIEGEEVKVMQISDDGKKLIDLSKELGVLVRNRFSGIFNWK